MLAPFDHLADVTPSDTVDLTKVARGIKIGVAGTLKVLCGGSEAVTLTNLAVGVFHNIAVRRVYSTGTTATGIQVGW